VVNLHEAIEAQILETLNNLAKDVGELTGETKGINARLDRLNGSVARHEKEISEIKTCQAEKAGANKVKKSILSKCWEIGKVPISLLLGAMCTPLIQSFINFIGKVCKQ
jgi:predicted  nucleic acid-binding Zn-ribbon protein